MRTLIVSATALLASAAAAQTAAPTPAPAQAPWAEHGPTPLDFDLSYPPAALAAGIEGWARLACTVRPDRTLDCAVHSETPAESGFGEAALHLSRRYVVSADHPAVAIGARVIVPVRFVIGD